MVCCPSRPATAWKLRLRCRRVCRLIGATSHPSLSPTRSASSFHHLRCVLLAIISDDDRPYLISIYAQLITKLSLHESDHSAGHCAGHNIMTACRCLYVAVSYNLMLAIPGVRHLHNLKTSWVVLITSKSSVMRCSCSGLHINNALWTCQTRPDAICMLYLALDAVCRQWAAARFLQLDSSRMAVHNRRSKLWSSQTPGFWLLIRRLTASRTLSPSLSRSRA